jgi:hypothetical protein
MVNHCGARIDGCRIGLGTVHRDYYVNASSMYPAQRVLLSVGVLHALSTVLLRVDCVDNSTYVRSNPEWKPRERPWYLLGKTRKG